LAACVSSARVKVERSAGGRHVSAIDMPHLRQWIGKASLDSDTLGVRHARLMAATLGLPREALAAGSRLPPLWHWLYFLEGLPPGQLGRDGHPARGGFLPPVPLAIRMWAGGRVSFFGSLLLGATVEKRSTVSAVEHKRGAQRRSRVRHRAA
jgi:3-methylfumaryl-CoA hydratase